MSKIAIIGPAYPLRGGLATFNERMAREFISEGHTVKIYTFSLQYPSILFPGKSQYSDSPAPKDLDIDVCINSINPLNWITVGKKIRNENPDIVIVRYWLPFMAPCLGTICKYIKKNSNIKIVSIVDNIIPHEKRPGDDALTRYFVQFPDAFLTMSEIVDNDLRKFTNSPSKMVNHPLIDNFGEGLDPVLAKAQLGIDDKFTFLFFGFIRAYKGLDLLLQAMELFDHDAPIQIVVAGEFYAGETDINTQMGQCKNRHMLILHTHFIRDQDVPVYFSAADCVIQPYRGATQSGVTPVAYFYEVPMIVTNVGSLADMVPPSLGIVCEPTPQSIYEAMKEMMHFDINRFKQNIPFEKQKYAWKNITDGMRELAYSTQKNPKS